jgi:hypothetical protein
LATPAPALLALGKTVLLADKNVEAAIRKELGKPQGDLHELELSMITSLNLNDQDIVSLDGIQACRNLRMLVAERNEIQDITPVLDLRQLDVLSLNNNPLMELSLEDGADLSILEFLPNLSELYLGKAGLKRISMLAGLTKLKRLGIGYNGVKDIRPLIEAVNHGGLRSGSFVDLRMNPLERESVEDHIPFLRSRGIEVSFMTQADIDRAFSELRRGGSVG